MRIITHGLGTAVLIAATAFFTLVQLAHVDRAFQQITSRSGGSGSGGQVSLVSDTDSGHASQGHGHRRR